MEFPAEMLVDYVRVYQRKEQTNIGCDPPGYPTADYINRHPDTYNSKHEFYFILFPRVWGC
jgi:beta-glucan synthesis-associated protein KRE6